MSDTHNKIKVIWNDAKFFSEDNTNINISIMETEGYIEEETKDYLIIKNLSTKNRKTNVCHPRGKKPTFFFIPKCLVVSVITI